MSKIDWRAFWTSLATVLVALIVYAIIIEPIVKKEGEIGYNLTSLGEKHHSFLKRWKEKFEEN